ncbi:MAG: hypothetical protein HY901_19850 [Deltaproteobacteria bacterium]|nr:hypothetical protein [Deltaproteobacteria bacterium]
MRMLIAFTFLAVSLSACGFWGGYRTPRTAQRDYAHQQLPAELAGVAPATARVFDPPRDLRVRFHLDAEFRSEMHSEERLRRMVESASAALESQIGVRLVFAGSEPWARRAPAESMQAMLEEAHGLEQEPQVDVTVFVTGGRPLLTSNLHALGRARLLDPRFVIRAISDQEEYDSLRKALPLLEAKEIYTLARERARHKQVVVFLHEWAHAFGVPHQKFPLSLLCELYDKGQRAFGPEAEGLLAVTLPFALDRELARDARLRRMREAVRGYLETHRTGDWVAAGRDQLLAYARGTTTAAPDETDETGPEAQAPASDPRAEARQRAALGDVAGAWRILAPLAAAAPTDLELQRASCRAGVQARREGPVEVAASEACRRAAELDLKDPWPLLALANAATRAENPAEAAQHAFAAKARLESGTPDPAGWRQLMLQFQSLSSPTLARAASTRAGESPGPEWEEWERPLRRRLCLPTDAAAVGIEPEREWEYAAGIGRLAAQEQSLTEQAVQQALGRFPGTPGRAAMACSAEMRRNRWARARRWCEAALAAQAECLPARIALGLGALNAGLLPLARSHLLRALDLDPGNSAVWEALARIYLVQGDQAGLNALQARHRATGTNQER